MNPKPVNILPTMTGPSEVRRATCGAHRASHDGLTDIEGRALVAQTSEGGRRRQEA
jgi:hypothetical protein